jgi:hypothetical protein
MDYSSDGRHGHASHGTAERRASEIMFSFLVVETSSDAFVHRFTSRKAISSRH